jgi:hypothetical protein
MPNESVTDTNKSPEPPRTYPGAPPDSPPERIYEPYAQKGLHDASYKPYSEKAVLPDPPYEPYKGI